MDTHKVEADAELEARAEAERPEYPSAQVRPFVIELANRGRVRAEEWAVRMNSYERRLLVPHLETGVFVQHTEHCLKNCSIREGVSYDDAAINELLPDAIRRLREMGRAIALQQRQWQDVTERSEELAGQLASIRSETRRMTALLTFVVNWCEEKPEDERPAAFRKDTYMDGVRYAKWSILRDVLGRLEPGATTVDGEVVNANSHM